MYVITYVCMASVEMAAQVGPRVKALREGDVLAAWKLEPIVNPEMVPRVEDRDRLKVGLKA